jgi:hypothetical protein
MNDYERSVYDALTRKGNIVLRTGWPDFLVLDKHRRHGYALELKRGSDRLSAEQEAMHAALAFWGMQVRVVRPDGVDALVRAKGKTLDLPTSVEQLKHRLEQLTFDMQIVAKQVNQALHELSGYEQDLEAATVVFDVAADPLWVHNWNTRLQQNSPAGFDAVVRTVDDILSEGTGDD